jgi:porin
VKTTIAAALVALAVGAAVPASAQTAQQGTVNAPVTTATSSTAPAPEQGPAPTPPQTALTVHDWLKRPQLLGDWGGARTTMADKGVTLGAAWTQFFQWAPMQSPNGDERDFLYGGKLDFRAASDFGKMDDRFKGLSASAHVEFRYGDVPLLAGGTLLPTNSALLIPATEGSYIDVTSLYVSKMLSDSTVLQAGRFNMFENYGNAFTGGEGLDKFQNIAFVLPPLLARTTPPIAEGVFISSLRNGDPFITGGLYESTRDGFFQNGATLYGSVTMPLHFWEAPGHYNVTGTYSSIVATSLDQTIYTMLPPLPGNAPVLETKKHAYTIDARFDQYLWFDPATKTGFGLFGMIGVSDGNPSVIDLFGHLGIGGTSPIPHRELDNFGVGYYFGGVSQSLRDTLDPVIRIRNENGMEAFYNVAVTGWSKVSADVQFIDPFAVGSKTRTFFSIRWKLIF